ncbi:MAG: monovalent cation/H(+) antiporter subunit G [Actinomycetota bacterium]|nr:monovalent cation/H(+) antiporter subunit G [Rubrobacter sp.]MDQ3507101.1 monovalent cation/H(+) antiporter subunit G [Actinomycetota bacterium]
MTLLSDILIVFGLLALSVGVYGIVAMPDVYLKLHATSKAALLGAMPILLATAIGGGAAIAAKAAMISVLLLLTTPIATHAITKAVALTENRDKRDL